MSTSASAVSGGAPARLHLGLSLAGGVSTGSWTAGVLDYLAQALDAWEHARRDGDPMAPPHEVVIASIAGASAGAQAGALLAIGARRAFPHVRLGATGGPPDDALRNPLFAGWVGGADVRDFLDVRDGAMWRFRSLLDGSCTDEIAQREIASMHTLPPCAPRGWLADPLRVGFTVTNLEGVPMAVPGDPGEPAASLRLHADALRFALRGVGGTPVAVPVQLDEQVLEEPAAHASQPSHAWLPLVRGAAASGALPVVLHTRVVERPIAAYMPYRFDPPPSFAAGPSGVSFQPSWTLPQAPQRTTIRYTAADGGVLVNDPVDLARGRLPAHALSAVLMIDPQLADANAEPPPQAEHASYRPLGLLAALARAIWNDARVAPLDAVAARRSDDECHFLIVPARANDPRRATASALAGACLGGFGGYFHREYRLHDYQLGRHNAQWAMRHHLTLPDTHPLFDHWTDTQKGHYRVATPHGPQLPIVPLMPALRDAAEPVRKWPAHLDPTADLAPLVDRRLDAVVRGLLLAYVPRCLVGRWLLLRVWRWFAAGGVRDALLARAREELGKHGL